MVKAVTRTHVLLPEEVIADVDRLVGRRGRSRFLAEAAAEKIARAKLALAAARAAGALAAVDVPGWEASDLAAEWVHASRRADDARLASALDA